MIESKGTKEDVKFSRDVFHVTGKTETRFFEIKSSREGKGKKKSRRTGTLLLSKLFAYLLLLLEELFFAAPFEEALPFLAAPLLLPLEEALELPLEALLLEVALLLAFEEALLALPFFAALLVPALLLFLLALFAAPPFLAAPFDALFEELFAAPFEEALPAAFFAVAMLF